MWYQWQWLSWIMKCVLGLVGNGEGAMREEVRCNQSRWAAAKRGNCITGTLGGEWQKPNFRLKTNHKWLGTSFKCMKDWVAAVLSWMSGSTQTFHFCFSHPKWYHLQSLKLASPLFDRGRTKVKYNGWTHLFLTSYLFAQKEQPCFSSPGNWKYPQRKNLIDLVYDTCPNPISPLRSCH